MSAFALGSPLHFLILSVIAGLGTGVGWGIRHRRLPMKVIPALGILIVVTEGAWYVHLITGPWVLWPGLLPLHLCDITLWLTALAALRRSQALIELAYYWGLAGTTMALLTPEVQGLSWSYPLVQFFVSHGLVVVTLLVMSVSRTVPMAPSGWIRAFLWLQVVALFLAAFNVAFGTNYLYLLSKPAGASMLDLFGPWPWYLVAAEATGALLFFLLSLPFKRQRLAGQ